MEESMQVFVTDKAGAHDMVKRAGANALVSLLDPGDRLFLTDRLQQLKRLHLSCEDVLDASDPHAPTLDQVDQLLAFGRQLPVDAVVVVHCFAGVSRSTAAAVALMAQELQHQGHDDPVGESLRRLLDQRPQSCPNPVISRFADELLGFDGNLHLACEEVAQKKLFKLMN